MTLPRTALRRTTAVCLSALVVLVALVAQPAAQAAPVPGQGTWQTTLQARDLDGNGVTDAFYDTVLNITWLRDANANRNNGNDGLMTWEQANAWANNLRFGGYSDWRLPTMVDTGVPGCLSSPLTIPGNHAGGLDCGYNVQTSSTVGNVITVYSEMASLYYDTLGNKAYCPPGSANCNNYNGQVGWGLTNSGDFIELRPNEGGAYWSGLEYMLYPDVSWAFTFWIGYQSYAFEEDPLLAMAVRPGDSPSLILESGNSIPEPSTLVLAVAALVGLGHKRRRHFVQPI